MLSVKWLSGVVALLMMLFAVSLTPSAAHPSTGVEQQLEQYFSGRVFAVSWREGGAIYGTYYFARVAFCSSGAYALEGHGERTTVLDNTQYSNWQEQGT